MDYVLGFDKLMHCHKEITGQQDSYYPDMFGAFCIYTLNIPDHDWQMMKRECMRGQSIYDTLLQVAKLVPSNF